MQTTTVMRNGVDLGKLADNIQAISADPALAKFNFSLDNQWVDGGYNQSAIGNFYGVGKIQKREAPFILANDEPEALLGNDNAPNPVEFVLHALAGCLTTSMVYHAAARGHEIERITTSVEGDLDLRGFLGMDSSVRKGFNKIKVSFDIQGNFTEEEKLEILNLSSFSPVLDIVTNGVPVTICLGSKQKAELIDC
jgi:uncharacterized OsmC-like protein